VLIAPLIVFLVFPLRSALDVLLECIFIKVHAFHHALWAHLVLFLAANLALYHSAVSVYRIMAHRHALVALKQQEPI
jgi:hypothetical protein